MFNIPLGALISAMASTESERAKLSSSRGLGAIIGTLLPMVIFPVILSATESTSQLGYTLGIGTCALIGLITCLLACKMTYERKELIKFYSPEDESNIKFSDILVVIRKNRAFLGISLAATGGVITQTLLGTLGVYQYRDVMGAFPLMSIGSVLSVVLTIPALVLAPKLVSKIGTEKTLRGSLLCGIVSQIILFFLPNNVWIYMILGSFSTCFIFLPILMQWGMVGEAIEYNEYITGKRTEGSIFGTFNLFRRIGQAIAASAGAFIISVVGYDVNLEVQAANVLTAIRSFVILMPIAGALLSYVALRFIWNITPEIRNKMSVWSEQRRAEFEAASSN
jgi:GPH family glycoside/pentoside/hexuronide:cation symporter